MTYKQAGFTLIELLIALGLGMALIVTAVSGVRLAAQCSTIANALSLENAMMRAGYLTAQDEIDFWGSYDDPEDRSKQRLRHSSTLTGNKDTFTLGLPFAPFTNTMPDTVPADAVSASSWWHIQDGVRAWTPADTAWSADNPRTWWRGDLANHVDDADTFGNTDSDLRFGRHAMISNKQAKLTVQSSDGVYGSDVLVPHTWLANQMHGLMQGLGFYGMSEYLPKNSVYAWYAPYSPSPSDELSTLSLTRNSGIPYFLTAYKGTAVGIHPTWMPYFSLFSNDDGEVTIPRGLWINSKATIYAMPSPAAPFVAGSAFAGSNNVMNLTDREHLELRAAYWRYYRFYFAAANLLPSLQQHLAQYQTDGVVSTMNLSGAAIPSHWPNLSVSVSHYVSSSRFVSMCRVRVSNPLDGSVKELTFPSFGTSLRGARQQRRPDMGWARWDNDSDHSGQAAYRTLDSY